VNQERKKKGENRMFKVSVDLARMKRADRMTEERKRGIGCREDCIRGLVK